MKRGVQCFEDAPKDFHNLSTIAELNVAIDQSLVGIASMEL